MASAHFSARPKPISRSSGESATAAAAYRARCELTDERTGHAHDYSKKSRDVLFSGMYAPANAPAWTQDRAEFWNRVEARENRKDSQLAREFTIALPNELTTEQNRRLVQDFVRENFVRRGYVADVNIHRPHPWGDQRNVHAHILVPLRKFEGQEWGRDKDRFIDGKPDVTELKRLRDHWEKLHNKTMERYGFDARISMQKLSEQGIDRIPEIHLGKAAASMHRRGIETERSEQLRDIRTKNRAAELLKEMEPTQVLGTVEAMRKREEEQDKAGVERKRGAALTFNARELVAAVRSLAATMGGQIANVLGMEPDELARRGARLFAGPAPSLRPVGDRRPTPLQPAPSPARGAELAEPSRPAEVRPFIPADRPAARITPPTVQPVEIRPPADPPRPAARSQPARSNDNDSRPAAGRANDNQQPKRETLRERMERIAKASGENRRVVIEDNARDMTRELKRPPSPRRPDQTPP